jgi:putative CocE/NonD family hydrolase
MATVSTGQAITTEFDVPATMRDGVVLRANVYRPATEGRFPVLLQRLPYGKDLPGAALLLDPLQAARRGFVVIVQDTRGRFRSDGDWYPLLYEAQDGYDTVQWAAALPYADGSVGMYGASYFGFTQWAAAREHPEALKAMIPTVTWQRADDGMYLRGGAFELGIQAQWNLMMGADVVLRRHAGDPAGLAIALNRLLDDFDSLATDGYRSLPLRELAPFRHNHVAPVMHDVFVAPDMESTPVFRAATHVPDLPSIEVPTFSIGGWYDIFLAGTLQGFRAMREQGRPARLLVGPWSHGGMSNPIGSARSASGPRRR